MKNRKCNDLKIWRERWKRWVKAANDGWRADQARGRESDWSRWILVYQWARRLEMEREIEKAKTRP